MKNAQGRERWIDCARGMAIILVVLGHVDLGQNPLCKWISSFHVPVFFVLSGVLVAIKDAYAGRPLKQVVVHKAKQLLYPFFTFSLMAALYYCLCGRADRAVQVIYYTVTLDGFNALWFLPAMWMAECMLLVLLRSKMADWLGTAVLVVGTTVYSALQYYVIGGAVTPDTGILFLILNGLCRAGIGAVLMMAGYKGYSYAIRMKTKRGRWAVMLAFMLVGWLCGQLNGMPDLHYCILFNPVLYYLAALLQAGGLIMLCAFFIRRCGVLEFFGRNSLIVMATHYVLPLIGLAQAVLARAGTGMRYVDDLLACALVLVMEVSVIWLVNRCLPFMLRIPPKR